MFFRKYSFFIIVFVWASLGGFHTISAQKKAKKIKASIYKAQNAFETGTLDVAKQQIDLLFENPKKASRTNYKLLRAKIYRALMLTEEFEYRRLHDSPGIVAGKLYAELVQKEEKWGENSLVYVESYNALNEIWAHQLKTGSDQYDVKNYEKANKYFLNALELKPDDSVSLVYAGHSCLLLKDFDCMFKHYYRMVELDIAEISIYRTLIRAERLHRKNLDKALELISEAKKFFPRNQAMLLREEISIYVEKRDLEASEALIAKLPEKVLNDIAILRVIADLYDEIARKALKNQGYETAKPYIEKAIDYYKKALKLRPREMALLYNLGLLYVLSSNVYYDELRAIPYEEYKKRKDELEGKGKAFLNQGYPYLKAAHKQDPTEMDVLTTLAQVAYQLGLKKEEASYKKKLEALSPAGEEKGEKKTGEK